MIMPEIGKNIIEFTNYSQQQESPFCIYADFESIMKKESEKKMIHEISGYSLCVVSPYEEPQIDSYRGADAGKVFTLKLESLGKEVNKKIKNADAKMIFTNVTLCLMNASNPLPPLFGILDHVSLYV